MTSYACATNSTYGGVNLSDGVATVATHRSRHVAARKITSIQLVYLNGKATAENGTDPVTYKCAVEYNGVVRPLTFAGVRTITVATSTAATTDLVNIAALGLTIPKGATFFIRTLTQVTAGGKWAYTATMNRTPAPPYGDGITVGSDVVDSTGLLAAGANNSALLLPIVIANQDTTDQPSVIIYGDSIPTGGSDVQDGVYDLGYVVRALNRTVTGAGIPYANVALSGETVQGFITGGNGTLRKALPTSIGFRDAIVAYGTNDLAAGRTAAQVQADLSSLYTTLSGLGLRVWGVTILPRTTSSDSWATTTNQTPVAGFTVGGARDQVNAWLRGIPSPLAGVIDVADVCESARGSGAWTVASGASTVDGIHPTSTTSKAMASVVPVSLFGAPTATLRLA